MTDDPDNFLEKYEAHVRLSDKRYARREPIRFSDWNVYSTDYCSEIRTEPYLEVTLPQHRLQQLVERDRYFDQLIKQNDYSIQVVNQMVQDELVRKENPAVEKAYQKYKALLELCRN